MERNNNAAAWQPSSALKAAEMNDYTKSRIQRNSQHNRLQVAKKHIPRDETNNNNKLFTTCW